MGPRPLSCLLVCLVPAACVPVEPYSCASSTECVSQGGAQGVCEANGFCGFPDPTCGSGRRFGALAPAGVAGTCVTDPAGGCGGSGQECCDQNVCGVDLVCAGVTCTCLAEIFVGSDHSCLRKANGTVWCWGRNEDGGVGDGSTTNRHAPVEVSALAGAVQIAAGEFHSCALKSDGGVLCWGKNDRGQLGDGSSAPNHKTPVAVKDLPNVVELGLGEYHGCARTAGGDVYCWGRNDDGQLGLEDGDPDDKRRAEKVGGLSGVTRLHAGNDHNCALAGDRFFCWGRNGSGQLADPALTPWWQPAEQPAFAGAAALALGGDHTCALWPDGTVSCVGLNNYGQLGDGTDTDRTALVAVADLTGAVELAAGDWHTCARTGQGAVVCWGRNDRGQLGDGTTSDRFRPVRVEGLDDAVQIVAGERHTCARRADGTLWCWGANAYGQLGDGSTADAVRPVVVAASCP